MGTRSRLCIQKTALMILREWPAGATYIKQTSIKKGQLPPHHHLRNYWPKEETLNGTYKNPPIKKVE
jgi:hypothetical protein